MSLIASLAVIDKEECLGTAMQVSTSKTVIIELENGFLYCFDAYGKRLETFTSEHGKAFERGFKAFAIIGDRLIVANPTLGTIDVMPTSGEPSKISIKVPEQPEKMIRFYDGQSERCIACPNIASVQLLSLPAARDIPAPEVIAAASGIPPYKIFKYHITGTTLALLCARGVVQLWHLPSISGNDNDLREMCTICSADDLPSLSQEPERDEAVRNAREIFSVLIHSTSRVLLGHRDGRITIWNINDLVSGQLTVPRNDHGQRLLTKRAYVAMSESGHLINNLLECHTGTISSCVISCDTRGCIRLWRFQEDIPGQHRLFDKSIIRAVITLEGWLVAGGKEGNGEEDACGLNGQVRAVKLDSLLDGLPHQVKDLGPPSLAVWDLKLMDLEGTQHIAVSLMRRGKAWLEVWDSTKMG